MHFMNKFLNMPLAFTIKYQQQKFKKKQNKIITQRDLKSRSMVQLGPPESLPDTRIGQKKPHPS